MSLPAKVIDGLRAVETADDEIALLNDLIQTLNKSSTSAEHCSSFPDVSLDELLEEERTSDPELSQDQRNLSPLNADDALAHADDLNYIVSYIFERRFGWSEGDLSASHSSGSLVPPCRRPSIVRRPVPGQSLGMMESRREELHCKSQINELLDLLIVWLKQQEVSLPLLMSYNQALLQAHSKPVVRNRCLIHTMDWLGSSVTDDIPEQLFHHIKAIVILGLTDVWSAIRNATVARLTQVIEHFSLSDLNSFFTQLVEICQCNISLWQAVEGAVMGISAVISRFQWVGLLQAESCESVDASSPKMEYFLKFGREEMKVVPEFISCRIQDVIYSLLAHPQLTVRENAIKAYTLYISRCDFKESLSSFNAVIQQLCRGTGFSDRQPQDFWTDSETKLPPGFVFMDAYLAEGLLGLCVHLVKHIPPGFLLPQWPLYFSTFNLYLMHPASTVRQTASSLFKFIVAKDSSSPVILKLILHGLVSQWKPDVEFLAMDRSSVSSTVTIPRLSVEQLINSSESECGLCSCWQWREGRLLAYELILQFLIKNHLLYTFGTSQTSAAVDCSQTQSISSQARIDKSKDAGVPATASRSLHHSFKATSSRSSHKPITAFPPISAAGNKGFPDSSGSSSSDADTLLSVSSPSSDCVMSLLHASRCFPAFGHKQHHDHQHRVSHRRARCLSTSADMTSTSAAVAAVASNPSGSVPVTARHGRYSIATSGLSSEQILQLQQVKKFVPRAGSDKRKQLQRMESFGPIQSLQTLIRHHTYYNKPTIPFRIPGTLVTGKAVSLLTNTSEFDAKNLQNVEGATLASERADAASSDSSGKLSDWFSELQLPTLSSMLTTMLYQCIESLADPMWELRRMAGQVLPCVVEVLRWYDMALLLEECDKHMTGSATTVVEYGMMLAAKYSMQHAANLGHFQQRFAAVGQNSTTNENVIEQIIDSVRCHGNRWSSAAVSALRRPIIDKMTIVAMEVIMLDHAHFHSDVAHDPNAALAVSNVLANIYCQANPTTDLAARFVEMGSFSTMSLVPPDGFLSCGLKAETGKLSWFELVEKSILSELQNALVIFCNSPSLPDEALILFPLLSTYIHKFTDDDTLPSLLMDGVTGLCATIIQTLPRTSEGQTCTSEGQTQLVSHVVCGLENFTQLVSAKTVEIATLRQILDLFRQLVWLVEPVKRSQCIESLLAAVAARLAAVTYADARNVPALPSVTTDYTDLTLLSNDIPIAVTNDDNEKLPSSDEDDLLEPSIDNAEIQLLSVSGNSGLASSPRQPSFTAMASRLNRVPVVSHRPTVKSVTESESDSDWDAWSDTELEQPSEMCEALRDFVRRIHDDAIAKGHSEVFKTILEQLSETSRHHIEAVLWQ